MANNDYALSPSNYIEKEIQKEIINLLELEQEAQNSLLTHIDRSISFSFKISKMERTSIEPLLDDISDLVEQWRQRIKKDKSIL